MRDIQAPKIFADMNHRQLGLIQTASQALGIAPPLLDYFFPVPLGHDSGSLVARDGSLCMRSVLIKINWLS
jgi:hypothetical protein